MEEVARPRGSVGARGASTLVAAWLVFAAPPAAAQAGDAAPDATAPAGVRPGQDKRLDQQPDRTANLGANHRFAGLPLTLGGNVNWTPGYTTRLTEVQTASVSGKVIVDAYGLWTFNPGLALRVSFSNLDPREYVTGSSVDGPDLLGVQVRETSQTRAPTFINVQLRLEMKL